MTAPNIILFLIDDLGCRDLGCFGSTFYETPNLDRLASEGVVFNNAYATCPVCSPTRASIMSGQYPARVGITNWIGARDEGKLASVPYLHYLPLEQKSVAAALRDGGYQTWHIGKWHLGDSDFYPEHHGFDINIGGSHHGSPRNYFAPWPHVENIDPQPEGTYITDYLTDRAVKLISGAGDQPFFMHLSHYAVHTPIEAPEVLIQKYRRKAAHMKLDQVDPYVEGEPFPFLHKSDKRVRRRILQSDAAYAAMIENLDANIGRVLQALEESGQADHTLVVFTSDNGGLATSEGSPTCNFPMREGKGWGYEGGVRVCQMARWPGRIRPGSRCDDNVTSTDLYPTFLEAACLPPLPHQHCDGVSLLPCMTDGRRLEPRPIFWHYPHYGNQGGTPCAAVVEGEWKLLLFFEDQSLELYNLTDDVTEVHNLAERHPDIRDRLFCLLTEWQEEVEALLPEPNLNWQKKIKRPLVENNAHR